MKVNTLLCFRQGRIRNSKWCDVMMGLSNKTLDFLTGVYFPAS